MDETKNTSAIVLNRQPYREADSLVIVYTLDFGKLTLIARGTKKLKSKLAGHLEPITLSDILVVKGKGFDYIGSALARDVYLDIKDNLNKLYFTGRALNLFSRLVKEDQPDERLFFLTERWLKIVADCPPASFNKDRGGLFFSFFALKLMTELGYRPEMRHCLHCQQPIKPGKNYFNLKNGGLICGQCFSKNSILPEYLSSELLTISDNCVKIIRFIIDNKFQVASKIKLDKKLMQELFILVNNFLNFHT